MTLITYLSRVHFADGVLEVALSSELELNHLSRPLLVAEQDAVSSEFSERVTAGLPFWCDINFHEIAANASVEQATSDLLQRILEVDTDVVIAFGSATALTIADACRRRIDTDSLERRYRDVKTPKLFAIPGVDGLPAMSMPRNDSVRTKLHSDDIQPTAVIMDPTLIIGESVERTSSAIADTLARCLSAHFSDAYNPPADGIALEGVKRILRNLSALISDDSLDMRRELMAASLNGSLAMQKESGISHELCKKLLHNPPQPVDKGELMRLLILVEIELYERVWTPYRRKEVRDGLGVPSDTGLHEWLSAIMETLPLPASLSKLGFKTFHLNQISKELVSGREMVPSASDLTEILHSVELGQGELLPASENV